MQASPKDLHNKILGRQGEDLTVKYLKKRGYKILERNFKTPFGEADIIARKKDTYCFVEVKTRSSGAFGAPYEAVNAAKQERYRRIAQYYCAMLGDEPDCRYDVAAIEGGDLEYFENAYI